MILLLLSSASKASQVKMMFGHSSITKYQYRYRVAVTISETALGMMRHIRNLT